MGKAIVVLKNEFQLKKIIFSNSRPEVFYTPQFLIQHWKIFLAFRAFVLVYMTVWLLFHAIDERVQGEFHWYLTNWAEVIQTFYFLIACISSFYGYFKHQGKIPSVNWNNDSRGTLGIFFQLHWLFFNIAADIVVVVVILFWALAAPVLPSSFFKEPIAYHLHVVNLIFLILDLFYVSVPVHLMHFIYSLITVIIYLLSTLILHWSGVKSDIYPEVLDWKNLPTRSALYSLLGAALVFLSHLLVFGLYKLRVHIQKQKVEANGVPVIAPVFADKEGETNAEIVSLSASQKLN